MLRCTPSPLSRAQRPARRCLPPQWLGSAPTEKIEVVRHALPQFHTLLPRKLLPLPLSLSLSLQCQKKRRFPPFQGYRAQPAVSSETCFIDNLSNLSSFFPPPLAASPKQTCSALVILKHPSVRLSLSHCLSLSLSVFLSPPSHCPSRTHTHLTALSTLHQLSPSGNTFPPFPLFLLRDRLLGRVLTSSPPFTPKPPPLLSEMVPAMSTQATQSLTFLSTDNVNLSVLPGTLLLVSGALFLTLRYLHLWPVLLNLHLHSKC